MPVCASDPSHQVGEWWRRNELGRWYECEECHSTMLVPNARYRALLFVIRFRRLLRRGVKPFSETIRRAWGT
ncbi:MAG: hypothetical protein M3Q29_06825 [Chloroflexota bacterium]|nr:hypothetical protein [Chloroflexota bacterium]